MSNTNHVNYHETLASVSSGLDDVVVFIEHMSESHLEIINKVKLIRALGMRSRANETNKINVEIGVAECKTYDLLDNAKFKSHATCAKKSNLAESVHEVKKVLNYCLGT